MEGVHCGYNIYSMSDETTLSEERTLVRVVTSVSWMTAFRLRILNRLIQVQ